MAKKVNRSSRPDCNTFKAGRPCYLISTKCNEILVFFNSNPYTNDLIGTFGLGSAAFFIFTAKKYEREVAMAQKIMAMIDVKIQELNKSRENQQFITQLIVIRKLMVDTCGVRRTEIIAAKCAILMLCLNLPIINSSAAPLLVLGVTILRLKRFIYLSLQHMP